jgi:ATP synthase subunit 6
MFSPLESFELNILFNLSFLKITDISTQFAFLIIFLFFLFFINSSYLVPTALQNLFSGTYKNFFNIFKNQIKNLRAQSLYPLLLGVFLFVLFLNLFNLFIYNTVITGHIIITLFISFTLFFGFVIIAFLNYQEGFFDFFIPKNVPSYLKFLLIIIEVLSFLIRPFSLAIRLFANILAGHTSLHIFGSFFIFILSFFPMFIIIPFVLCALITTLELGVAFIQAYVFFVLLCVYLNDGYEFH